MTRTQESDNVSDNQPQEKINIIIPSIIPSIRDEDDVFIKKFDNFIDNNKNTIKKSNKVELLMDHIKHNLDNLSDRVRILRFKYSKYKKWYDKNNIAIIVISSILTLFSAITNQLKTEIDKSVVVQHIVGIIPIILGVTITLIAAIMKFKKLQEKMETISNLIEKRIIVMSKLKKTSEDLYFKKNDNDPDDKKFEQLEATFLDETCSMCNNCIMQTEQMIKDEDYKEYLKKIKTYDDGISRIVFEGKEKELLEVIFHKDVDLKCEALRNASTRDQYESEMEDMRKRDIEKKEKEKEKERKKKEEKKEEEKKMNKKKNLFNCL